MKSASQLGFLKLPFARDETPEEHERRMLMLFRNRAELKKAYGEMQDEVYRLKDRLKQQEGATQRVQEMLETLEARLAVPESAWPTLVFYQLRRLWQTGHGLIADFCADLTRQQDERERKQHLADHNRRQFGRRQAAEQTLRSAEREALEATGGLTQLRAERARLTRFWHYFRRRALDHRIALAQGRADAANAMLANARDALLAIGQEPTPEFPGLSVEARRAINLASIAYAEVLCLKLARTPLVTLAREAVGRREASDEYGSRQECEAVMLQIERAYGLLQARTGDAQEIKARTERLRQVARFRNPADSAPTPESVAFGESDALAGEPLGSAMAARMPNVLAEDTWDLYRILLR